MIRIVMSSLLMLEFPYYYLQVPVTQWLHDRKKLGDRRSFFIAFTFLQKNLIDIFIVILVMSKLVQNNALF